MWLLLRVLADLARRCSSPGGPVSLACWYSSDDADAGAFLGKRIETWSLKVGKGGNAVGLLAWYPVVVSRLGPSGN
ncbi:hypothetical protein BT67DRAFT_440975 [Trichocladium antarcticum]|uniref:Uncharacterized protein n=1 Tax=Trichocladium antarcticum TaxID=1450529 RepID=A0AAN6ZF92_9PEZI|nr:hypothetical protein BT67DRAFT_440975 [Trichocladium antarcticum]